MRKPNNLVLKGINATQKSKLAAQRSYIESDEFVRTADLCADRLLERSERQVKKVSVSYSFAFPLQLDFTARRPRSTRSRYGNHQSRRR